ncbi:NADAR family protein [Nocardia sp. NPDC058058]|uniref:NADAR family protein n=1 Tax=Nocardia sp. NPDC058058 TaxID=3346317 RepID=UPI0036DCB00E
MDRAQLTAEMADGAIPEFLFFWGHTRTPGYEIGKWVLSQWWQVEFTVDGQSYGSAEHFMMGEKARLFGDEAIRAKILASATPADAKRLGREVRGFDQDTWVAHRFDIVMRGSIAKFGQHEALRDFLIATGDKVLVEAAPRDTIWGIGLGAENPAAAHPSTWRGENLLGFALMDAREALVSVA